MPRLHLSVLSRIWPSSKKSVFRGEVERQASPILRPGCGSTKRRSFTRSSRISTSTATSGSSVAVAVSHHLQDGRQAGSTEPVVDGVALAAIDQRLIAQTVAFFQQHQLACIDIALADSGAFRQGIVSRHG